MLTRAAPAVPDDPVLGQFLGFLAAVVARNPQRLQTIDAGLARHLQSLAAEVHVDLDTALSAYDE